MYVIDLGADTIKHGFSNSHPSLVYNCMARWKRDLILGPDSLVGSDEIKRPMERGVLVDPTLQASILNSILSSMPKETPLVISCPIFSPPSSRHYLDEIIFETYNFKEYSRVPASLQDSGVLIDLGFSNLSVIPVFCGRIVNSAVKRVGVGGKILTNLLKEQISFRHYDMSEDSWLVNHIKESCCYVANEFIEELRLYK